MTDAPDRSPDAETETDGGLPAMDGAVPTRDPGAFSQLVTVLGRPLVVGTVLVMVVFLILPVLATFAASFAYEWTGVLPTFVDLGAQRGLGGFWTVFGVPIPVTIGFSMLLALGGVVINLLVGVPIAYAVTRYDFYGRGWLNTFAVLPVVPGIILGVAFLKTYSNLPSAVGLMIGYSLLKAPYMVLAVQSSFESMDLRQLEESARSLGASWPRTFLTVVVPNAKTGIVAGAIVCWTLAAAEFNFSYIVYSSGSKPFSLFLFENISNNPFLQAAAAISIYFAIVVVVTALLQAVGQRGFALGGVR
ncbi:sulfate ABC transporter permease [Halobacteriales archaeon QH_1_68_42]|nr:MAG: sulfate ABC transporter permease [Halobacteriales archaeon QH_1_68_42]